MHIELVLMCNRNSNSDVVVVWSGDYYLRLLLEEDDANDEYSAIKKSSASVTYLLTMEHSVAVFVTGVVSC